MNETVAVVGGRYRWTRGPDLGHVDDVAVVAERIMHVLRLVGS
ncbi:hypothetical protein AB0K40_07070 [Nonomuraea bangladeshensis]|uniref:Uncharacterized protein n=1 Tax=Nonomuraea bangladeshensis TaxID=404385 RepID=A0ABV3GY94_9ACTN